MTTARDRAAHAAAQRRYRERKLAEDAEGWREKKRAENRATEPALIRARVARWQKRHPEARRAHNALNQAVSREEISKPSACENCGKETRLDGHHDDYADSLSVRWLCRLCHKAVH